MIESPMHLGNVRGWLAPALALCVTLPLLVACGPQAKAEAEIEASAAASTTNEAGSDIEKASYLLGYNQLHRMTTASSGVIDPVAFAKGVSDAANGVERATANENEEAIIAALNAAVQEKQMAAANSVIEAGAAYRAEFAQQPDVITLPSGLLYEVMAEGSGDKPGPDSQVTTHYHGTLIDGTVFDSSVDRGQPASFNVGGVIPGWTEALQLMNVGSKWRLVIPPELAYGERGAGGAIAPNSTLVFEVELLEIN